jgi:hypothetical protein
MAISCKLGNDRRYIAIYHSDNIAIVNSNKQTALSTAAFDNPFASLPGYALRRAALATMAQLDL